MTDVDTELRRLKRGLMTGDERTALSAYKAIYKIGSPAALVVNAELERFDLKDPLRTEATKLLAGLIALQRDLDETHSNAFIDRQLAGNCPQLTTAILRSARRMTSRDFRKSEFGDVVLLEHAAIDRRYLTSENVQNWLSQLPPEDLSGISRIYVVPHDLKNDWLGTYMPILGVVTIAWTTVVPPLGAFNRVMNVVHRHVLLHEIGHHVHKHWFGQDSEQEAEAEAYARKARYKAMPLGVRIAAKVFGHI
ncbi:MAG: hypothetical protein AB7O65_14790 [Candidatus Korobacteraceae bacterium]